MYDCTNRVKTALSEQKQDPLNTSVSVVAPEMQYSRSKSISQPFFTLLPTKGGVVGDVAQRDARAIITFETMYRKRSLQKAQGICAFCGMITKTVEINNACRLTARHPRSMGSTTELQ